MVLLSPAEVFWRCVEAVVLNGFLLFVSLYSFSRLLYACLQHSVEMRSAVTGLLRRLMHLCRQLVQGGGVGAAFCAHWLVPEPMRFVICDSSFSTVAASQFLPFSSACFIEHWGKVYACSILQFLLRIIFIIFRLTCSVSTRTIFLHLEDFLPLPVSSKTLLQVKLSWVCCSGTFTTMCRLKPELLHLKPQVSCIPFLAKCCIFPYIPCEDCKTCLAHTVHCGLLAFQTLATFSRTLCLLARSI